MSYRCDDCGNHIGKKTVDLYKKTGEYVETVVHYPKNPRPNVVVTERTACTHPARQYKKNGKTVEDLGGVGQQIVKTKEICDNCLKKRVA